MGRKQKKQPKDKVVLRKERKALTKDKRTFGEISREVLKEAVPLALKVAGITVNETSDSLMWFSFKCEVTFTWDCAYGLKVVESENVLSRLREAVAENVKSRNMPICAGFHYSLYDEYMRTVYCSVTLYRTIPKNSMVYHLDFTENLYREWIRIVDDPEEENGQLK